MEAPAVIKNNLSPAKILGIGLGLLVIFAILDVTGFTNWILYPVSTAKAKFSKNSTTSA